MIDTSSTKSMTPQKPAHGRIQRFYLKAGARKGQAKLQDSTDTNSDPTSSLIDQINNLNISNKPKKVTLQKERRPRDDSQMILDSRKNPPRSSTIERKNYNLHALSQNCVSKPLTQVSTVKDKVPITIDLTETDSVDENDPIQKIYIN